MEGSESMSVRAEIDTPEMMVLAQMIGRVDRFVDPTTQTTAVWNRADMVALPLSHYLPNDLVEGIRSVRTLLNEWQPAYETMIQRAVSFRDALNNGDHTTGMAERVGRAIFTPVVYERLQTFGSEARAALERQATAYVNSARATSDNMEGDVVAACAASLLVGANYFRAVAQSIEKDFGSGNLSVGVSNKIDGFTPRNQSPDSLRSLKIIFGLSAQQIEFALELGYTPEELLAMFREFNEADKAFFSYLLTGSVEGFVYAFTVNPYALSPEMTLFMSDFAIRLDESALKGNPSDFGTFENFINALLSIEDPRMTVTHMYPSHFVHGKDVRDRFLEMLFVGTYTNLEYQAFLIGMGYTSHQERFENQKALAGLWASLSVVLADIGSSQAPLDASISNLTNGNHGSLHFNFNYTCPITMERMSVSVNNDVLRIGSSVDSVAGINRIRELRRAQDEFRSNLLVDILTTGSTATLSKLFPPVAGVLELAGAASDIFGAINGWNEVVNALDEEQRRQFLAWFGAGVSTAFYLPNISDSRNIISVFEGLYNPNTVRYMNIWEESGLGPDGLRILDVNQVNTLFDDDPESRFSEIGCPQTQQDIRHLVEGGFPLFDSDGFDASRLDTAIFEIERILELNQDGTDDGIQAQFHRHIRGGGAGINGD